VGHLGVRATFSACAPTGQGGAVRAQARGGAVRRSDEARRDREVEEGQCAVAVPPVGEVKGSAVRWAGWAALMGRLKTKGCASVCMG
jgi:hypothetical protein